MTGKAQVHLDPLQPDVVVRPWTDMPVGRRDELQPDDKRFLELLDTVTGHNAAVKDQLALDGHVLAKRARALAELGVGNVQALAMLDVWVPAEHTRWVKADDVVEVSELLPGVRIDVLGPPTLQQVPELRSYASGSAEYWLGLAADGKIEPELQATVPDPEFQQDKEIVAAPGGFGRAAWLLDELRDTGSRQVLDIVHRCRPSRHEPSTGSRGHPLFEQLAGPVAENPHRLGKQLDAPLDYLWSTSCGEYRAIYAIDQLGRRINIIAVAHRRNAYRTR